MYCFKIHVSTKVLETFTSQLMSSNLSTEITQTSIEINGKLNFSQICDVETSEESEKPHTWWSISPRLTDLFLLKFGTISH